MEEKLCIKPWQTWVRSWNLICINFPKDCHVIPEFEQGVANDPKQPDKSVLKYFALVNSYFPLSFLIIIIHFIDENYFH